MKNLKLSIAPAGFDLMAQRTEIIKATGQATDTLNARINLTEDVRLAEQVDEERFRDIAGAGEMVRTINSKIREITDAGQVRKTLAEEENRHNAAIARLQKMTKLIWFVLVAVVVLLFFLIKH